MIKINDDKSINAIQNRFSAFLKVAVRNKKINFIEKHNYQKNQYSLSICEYSLSDSNDFVQSIVDSNLLKMAFDRLSEREKRIVGYRLIVGMSLSEIAERENATYVAVAVAIHRSLEKLRETIRRLTNEF